MGAAPRKYKPTFTESKPRPVYQRLTPLAWFCVFLVVLALLGGIIVAIRKLSDASGSNQSLDQRLGRPATAPTAVVAQPAQKDSAPVAVAVQESAPTVAADTAAVPALPVPTVVPTAPAAPAASQPQSDTAAPAAPNAQAGGVSWASQMAQQADGTWMAPKEVVAQASDNVKEYYLAARNRSLEDYLQQRDQILTTYYINNGLQLMHAYEAKRAQYGMNKSGEVSVLVKSFTQDGLTAQVDVTTKNWVNDVYDIKTKQLTKSDFKQQDSVLSLAIRFDPTGNRWKIESVLGVVRLH